jgi:hypothetical protein
MPPAFEADGWDGMTIGGWKEVQPPAEHHTARTRHELLETR